MASSLNRTVFFQYLSRLYPAVRDLGHDGRGYDRNAHVAPNDLRPAGLARGLCDDRQLPDLHLDVDQGGWCDVRRFLFTKKVRLKKSSNNNDYI